MTGDLQGIDVSSETRLKLEQLDSLLRKWTPKINLVAKSTLEDAWNRHVLDSAQIFEMMNEDATKLIDLGSGGGFPGLVIAILAQEKMPTLDVHLVESDARKCVFLQTVLRETHTAATIHRARIEVLPSFDADHVTARALAPLDVLLGFASQHMASTGTALFHKGGDWKKEVDKARRSWNFAFEAHRSAIDPNGVILQIEDIEHV